MNHCGIVSAIWKLNIFYKIKWGLFIDATYGHNRNV